mgnify:CR=1 FL=1
MGWWVYLQDATGKPVMVEPHREGGIVRVNAPDGPVEAEVSVSYNYSQIFHDALGERGPRQFLHRKRAGDLVPELELAVAKLGTDRDPDYWKPTKGNAGVILALLLKWARQHPDAFFEVH